MPLTSNVHTKLRTKTYCSSKEFLRQFYRVSPYLKFNPFKTLHLYTPYTVQWYNNCNYFQVKMETKQDPQLNQVMNLRFSMPVFHPNWYFPGSLDLPGWVSNDLWVLQISMICLLLSKVAMLCRDFFQNGIKTKYQSHHQRNHLLHLLLRYLLTDYRSIY